MVGYIYEPFGQGGINLTHDPITFSKLHRELGLVCNEKEETALRRIFESNKVLFDYEECIAKEFVERMEYALRNQHTALLTL